MPLGIACLYPSGKQDAMPMASGLFCGGGYKYLMPDGISFIGRLAGHFRAVLAMQSATAFPCDAVGDWR